MSIDPNQVKSIFLAAVEQHSPDQWDSYLDEACGDDARLRERVLKLLSAHQRTDQLTTEAAAAFDAVVSTVDKPDDGERSGTHVGPYTLIEKLGDGGMGVVFLAEQKEPVERQVALKIIRPGMDSQRVIDRFEGERQALAMMDHPNIAKVHDAGTTESGRPYFAMELVHGEPITQYCDAHQLSLRERLQLFIPVCQAVQHAHQKGIIHRDIKPSNILVAEYDGQGVPKVIDFGVAKAVDHQLAQKQLSTQYGQIVGTLEYMSPEQARLNPNDVDTRSDIYSLGTVLYELLSGSTPFERERLFSGAFDEALRIIESEVPVKPSMRLSSSDSLPSVATVRHIEPQRLTNTVRGELDWIAMKALEKDRARRYETATGFANDIQRYLNDEAVMAGPPSAGYRLRKFIRRNRSVLATVAIVALALIAGTSVATWQAVRAHGSAKLAQQEAANAKYEKAQAEQSAEKAESEAAISQAVVEFLNDDLLAQAGPDVEPDRDIKLRTVLDRASATIEGRFQDQPLVAAKIHMTLGSTYTSLGEYGEAEGHLEKAREIRRRELGPEHPDTLTSMNNLASAYKDAGRLDEALPLFEETLKLITEKLGPHHENTLATMNNVADAYRAGGRVSESLPILEEVLKLSEEALGTAHPLTLATMNNLAHANLAAGRLDEALRVYKSALKRGKGKLGPDHRLTLISMAGLAVVQNAGRLDEAVPLFEETLKRGRDKLGAEHPSTLLTMGNLAGAYRAAGRLDEAIPIYEETLNLRKKRLGTEHPVTLTSMNNLAMAYLDAGRLDEALPIIETTLTLRTEILGPDHPQILTSMNDLAMAYNAAGRLDEALLIREETLKRMKKTLGTEHPNTFASMNNLAVSYKAAGRLDEALPILEEVLKLSKEKLSADHSLTLKSMINLADSYKAAGRLDEALPILEEVLKLSKEKLGPKHPITLASMNNLARVYQDADRLHEALPIFEATLKLAKEKLGPEHPNTLTTMHSLASTYLAAKSPNKGVPLYEQLIAARRIRVKPDDPQFAGLLAQVALNLLEHEQYSAAEIYLRECLGIREKTMADHWLLFNTQSMLGGVLAGQAGGLLATDKQAAQKKFTEAEPLLIAGYEGMTSREAAIPAEARARLTESLERLVNLYTAWGKPDEAAKWQELLPATEKVEEADPASKEVEDDQNEGANPKTSE